MPTWNLSASRTALRKHAGTRKIPLSDSLLADLKTLQATSTNPLVFPAKMGGVEGHFLRMFQGLGKIAGLSNAKCHRFRDTYITDKVREGVDLPTIRVWVAHEGLETLALYVQALRHEDERARAAANRQERYTLIAEDLGLGYGTVRERLKNGERKTPHKTEVEKPSIKDT